MDHLNKHRGRFEATNNFAVGSFSLNACVCGDTVANWSKPFSAMIVLSLGAQVHS